MSRDQDPSNNLFEQQEKLIADIMGAFRGMTMLATTKVDSTASVGQAAASSLALETTLNGFIKSTEDLLTLTRALRELWAIGPLVTPENEGEGLANKQIEEDCRAVVEILGRMKSGKQLEALRQLGETGLDAERLRYLVDELGVGEGQGMVFKGSLKGLPWLVKGKGRGGGKR